LIEGSLVKLWAKVAALSVVVAGSFVPTAAATGPGGWDHLGTGATATTSALNNDVLAMNTDLAGTMYVAGKFTNAGGVVGRNRIASWNGTSWGSVGPVNTFGGEIRALAFDPATNRVFAGGVFQNAGGNADADFLAVWNGSVWAPFCTGATRLGGNVDALVVMGGLLYVGGEFQDGFGLAAADYMLACDLTTGTVSATTVGPSFPGPVYDLARDGLGHLYAGGNFQNVENIAATDYVASYSVVGGWTNLGSAATPNGGAVTGIVRAVDADNTNVYVGSDGVDIALIPQADHVARWNGVAWSAMGSNASGTDGYLPANALIFAMLVNGTHVVASGDWVNAGGNPVADHIAEFNGTSWTTLGSNGAGNGSLPAKSEALAWYRDKIHAGGSFTAAGGDPLASYIARYAPGQPIPDPRNAIKIVKIVIHKRLGTASMSVKAPGPGVLEILGKGIKHPDRSIGKKGKFVLTVKPKRATKAELKDDGRAKVTVKVRFTPTGGTAKTEKVKITLVLND
jgi:hypothetical protein